MRRRCQGNYCQGPATQTKKCKVPHGCFNYYDYRSFGNEDWKALESYGYVDTRELPPPQYGDYEYEQLNDRDLEILGSRGLIDNPNGGFDTRNNGWDYTGYGGINRDGNNNGWDYGGFESVDDQDMEVLKSRGIL